jgi:hypothetical protein
LVGHDRVSEQTPHLRTAHAEPYLTSPHVCGTKSKTVSLFLVVSRPASGHLVRWNCGQIS